jgi:hypothetical protein
MRSMEGANPRSTTDGGPTVLAATPRKRKLSTRNLGAGFVSAAVAATGVGIAAPTAEARGTRHVYQPKYCAFYSAYANGPARVEAWVSNYVDAGSRCSPQSPANGWGRTILWSHGLHIENSNVGIGVVRSSTSVGGQGSVHVEGKLRSYAYNKYAHYFSGVSHFSL